MTTYHNLWHAIEIGQGLISMLWNDCHEATLCGSARREKETVKDIEIVVSILRDRPPHLAAAELHARLHSLLQRGHIRYDEKVVRRGPTYQRYLAGPSDLVVELFVADEWNYG